MRYVMFALLAIVPLGGVRAQASTEEPLRLRPGDAVRLQVGGDPSFACGPMTDVEERNDPAALNRVVCEFDVDEEGNVLLPLVGIFEVAGVPFSDVRERIRSAFAVELLDPAVTITPLMRIAVLGEVRAPGLMRVDPTYTLADLLASAGGLGPEADRHDVRLVRNGAETRVSVGDAGVVTATRLRPGDQVVVGRRGWLSRNANVALSVGGSVLAAVLTSLILN